MREKIHILTLTIHLSDVHGVDYKQEYAGFKPDVHIHIDCWKCIAPRTLYEFSLPNLMELAVDIMRSRQNGRHFADDILDAFYRMKMYEFRLTFHCSLFPRVQSTKFRHSTASSYNLDQWWLVCRRIYASLGLNELRYTCQLMTFYTYFMCYKT